MTSNVIERLDGKLADLEIDVNAARAALVAVEQEIAELRRWADAWECPDCGFRMWSEHTNADGTTTCPCCAEARLDAKIAELRTRLDAVRVAFVALNRHCERLNIPITETAWIHGHRISAEDSDAGAAMLARLCDLLGITVEDATSNAEGGT